MGSEETTSQEQAQERRVGEATQRELDRAAQRKESERRESERLIEDQNARTEAHRRAFDESEHGQVHRQIEEAERIMRMPTPRALERIGSVVGDPTEGPAS